MFDNETTQRIFDKIQPILPSNYKKVVIRFSYDTDKPYSYDIYTKSDDDETFKPYSEIPNNNNIIPLDTVFTSINKILGPKRDLLDTSKRWNGITMIVDNSGISNTDFDYDDHSSDYDSYIKSWQDKYLTESTNNKSIIATRIFLRSSGNRGYDSYYNNIPFENLGSYLLEDNSYNLYKQWKKIIDRLS